MFCNSNVVVSHSVFYNKNLEIYITFSYDCHHKTFCHSKILVNYLFCNYYLTFL